MHFQDKLLEVIAEWNKDPIEDEWVFERFRRQYLETMSDTEAFEELNPTILILANESDESTSVEIMQTTINLAKKSNTSEIPSSLLDQLTNIEDKYRDFDIYSNNKLRELKRHYRIK